MYKLTFVWQKFCLVCFTKKHFLQDYCTKFFKLIIWIHQLIVFTCQTNSNHQVQQKSFFFLFFSTQLLFEWVITAVYCIFPLFYIHILFIYLYLDKQEEKIQFLAYI